MSILARNITKRFGKKIALDNVTVEAPAGKLVALLGPSGCGKTTLLRIIAGLEFPDEGQVLFEGEDATDRSARHRNVGFVFQHYALFRHMSIFENVAFSLSVRKRPRDVIETRVHELLKLVQLEDFAKRYPSQLSGGQRQRVALARALAAEPKVLLLDEPFGALDAKVRKDLRRWLRRLHDEIHVTSLFVTHDQEEALEVADQVVIFSPGKVEQVGTPDEVYNNPANPFVINFLGQVNIFHGRIQEGEIVHDGIALQTSGTIATAVEETARSNDGTRGRGTVGAPGLAGAVGTGRVKSYVRPHEIDLIHTGPDAPPSPTTGQVTWIHRIGPTVKVEVELDIPSASGNLIIAELPRARFAALNLQRGDRVSVVPRDARTFEGDFEI